VIGGTGPKETRVEVAHPEMTTATSANRVRTTDLSNRAQGNRSMVFTAPSALEPTTSPR
jgi:hypothetical protein